jgi:hypothetical protein
VWGDLLVLVEREVQASDLFLELPGMLIQEVVAADMKPVEQVPEVMELL